MPKYKKKQSTEIIFKDTFMLDASGRKTIALPELCILATPQGFRWLSEFFRKMAERKVNVDPYDPDDHQHLSLLFGPFNRRLSDELEIRVGTILPENRRKVLAKYGISEKNRATRNLVTRYAAISRHACAALEELPEGLKTSVKAWPTRKKSDPKALDAKAFRHR